LEPATTKNSGTAADLPVGPKQATDQQVSNFSMDAHMVALLLNEPFFSSLLVGVNKESTEAIPTAGVTVRDAIPWLYWNPRFVAALKPVKVRGLLKHEAYHLIFKHCTSRKVDPHIIWNWATDLAINSLISSAELPDGGLRPGHALDLSQITDPARLAKWQKVSALIESLPPNKVSEWYFAKLLEDEEVSETISGKGEPGGEGGEGIGPLDDHDGWGDLSDEEKEVAEGRIRQALEEAVKKCDATGNWGSVPGEARNRIREMVSNEVDWKSLLRSFVGRTQRAKRSSTMKRINRKYPYIHPGRKRGHSAHLAVYMDQSGSVSDQDMALLFGELNNLAKKVQFTLLPFDSSVDTANEIEWRRGQKVPPQRFRCGGTNFSAVAKHADENKHRFDGYIVLTDGECSDPGPSRLRRAWVIVPGRELMFPAPAGDLVIKMKPDVQGR